MTPIFKRFASQERSRNSHIVVGFVSFFILLPFFNFTSALENALSYPVSAMLSTNDHLEFEEFVNHQDANQNSALHIAAQKGHVSICQVLLQHGADVNIQNKHQQTPLHVVSNGRNKEILELLIKRGAETNTEDSSQRTPLHR